MSVLRRFFAIKLGGKVKKIFFGSNSEDFPLLELREKQKVCLLGEAKKMSYYHDKGAPLPEGDFVLVMGKKEEDLPELLLNLAPELCQCKHNEKLAELVLKMHEITPPSEQSLLWQRYFHAIAQATPEASMTFRRMAQNMGVIERPLKKVIMTPTGHFNQDSGRVIDRKSKARGHNYGNFLK